MAFEPKKFNDLYEDMRGRTTSALTDFEVGSVTRTMFESFAYELGLLYQKMNLVYLSGFVDTAEGSHLDNVVAVLGIQRSLPDYAVGKVRFIRDKTATDITIPVGTLVATEETAEKPKKVYTTIETVVLPKDQTDIEVNVQALERGQEQNADPETIVVMPRPIVGVKTVTNTEGVKLIGRQRETDDELRRRAKNALLSSGKANIAALENAVLALQGILDVRIIERFKPAEANKNYGMVEVVVDAPQYDKIKQTIFDAVENVRAAGVYALVREVEKIKLSGVFKIEITAQQNFTPEERTAFELKVRAAIEDFLRETKMGQPLVFSKMMKAILSVEGVEDLAEFRLIAKKQNESEKPYVLADNKIIASELERFYAREGDKPLIFVASENKILPVNIRFKATGLDKPKMDALKPTLENHFKDLTAGTVITISDIQTKLNAGGIGTVTELKIQPMSWREQAPFAQLITNYTPSFVEKAQLGEVFGYKNQLNIDGAFLIAVPNDAKEEAKSAIRAAVQARINLFLEELAPETNIVIEDLVAAIKKEDKVLDVQFAEKDWAVNIDSIPANDRLNGGKIEVKAFEKPFFSNAFLVTTDTTNVEVTIVKTTLLVRKEQNYPIADATKTASDIALFKNALQGFFLSLKQGENVKFGDLQNALQGVSIGYAFTIKELSISAGTQAASLTNIKDLKIRVSETAVLKQPITTVSIELEPKPIP